MAFGKCDLQVHGMWYVEFFNGVELFGQQLEQFVTFGPRAGNMEWNVSVSK